MSDLTERLQRTIRHDGPMSVAAFMAMCLHDTQDGYYATRPGLGRDFTTAPEISQVFGELLGLWVVHEWRGLGAPDPFHLIELGPGRGAMMDDMLRAASGSEDFIAAMRLCLVEASPALQQEQASRLAAHNPAHYASLEDCPEGPSIIVANEFLDCLPVRQFVVDGGKWRERQIGLNDDGELVFGVGPAIDPQFDIGDADSVEIAVGADALVETLANRFKAHPGRALFIDYGPLDSHPSDTLRAFKEGQQLHPLAEPGLCDLTADVDFQQLTAVAKAAELEVAGPVTQGAFLMSLGVAQRVEQLARTNPERSAEVVGAVEKLVAPDEMGERFKLVCLSSGGFGEPVGFVQGGGV